MAFLNFVARDLKLATRRKGEWVPSLSFYGLVTLLFPIAITTSENLLQQFAPGLIWIAALLATLISLDNLFKEDFEDGTLELWLLSQHSLLSYCYARIISHWVITSLPLILMTPIIAITLNLSTKGTAVLLVTLLLGTPFFTLVGAIGVALTTGIKKSSGLLPLLTIPFYLPVIIFATHAVEAGNTGLPVAGHLYVLAALTVLGFTLFPLAIAAALKLGLTQ